MNIEKYLERWEQAGIIQKEQSAKILKYEQEQPSASWVIFGLSGLGVAVVMTGLISLIAANWIYLSTVAKLVSYFILLGTLGYFTYKRSPVPGVVRESLLTAYGLLVLAGIGLIAQIYHVQADGHQAIFFWLVIILPVVLATSSRLLNNIWFVGFALATTLWVMDSNWNPSTSGPELTRAFIAAAAPYVFLAIGYSLPKIISEQFCNAARFWSYVTILIPFAIFGNLAWAHTKEGLIDMGIGSLPLIPLFAAALAIVCVLLRKIQQGAFLTYAICGTITATAILFLTPLIVELTEDHEIIGCALFILAWCGSATIAAAIQRRRLFDFAALVIAVRFIVVYFEVFGSLAATGLGLILSGGVILGTAFLWHKYRGQVAKTIQEAA